MIKLLTLSKTELQEQFWEQLTRHELHTHAKRYKQELLDLFANGQWQKLRPLLRELFAIESSLHKWKIWEAFWDNKGAKYQYEQIQKGQEWYDEAQYHLFNLEISDYYTDSNAWEGAIIHLKNIDTASKWHHKWCYLLSEIYCWKWKHQQSLEYLLKIDGDQVCTSTNLSQKIAVMSDNLKKVSLDNERIEFEKDKQYTLTSVFLEWIDSIQWEPWNYVVSLYNDEHNNKLQKWKFIFYCTDSQYLNDLNNPRCGEGLYAQLEELDNHITPETVVFEWVREWDLVFRKIGIPKKRRASEVMSNNGVYTIRLDEAQKSVKEKKMDYTDDEPAETFPVLAWQNGWSEVIIILNPKD